MKIIHLRTVASKDIGAAATWYEQQRPGLGAEFLLELDQTLERIANNPEIYVSVYRSTNRALLRRFPYIIYFKINNERIDVVAVLHQSRGHTYIKKRIEK